MKCPKCGTNIPNSAKFCTSCGVNIPEALEEQAKIKAEEEEKKKLDEEIKEIEEIKEAGKIKETEKNKVIEEIKENSNNSNNQSREKFTKKNEESNKKVKKKHVGIKVVFVLLIIIILLIICCYGLYKIDVLPEPVASIFESVEELFEKDDDSDKKDDDKKSSKNEVKNTVENTVDKEKNEKKITKIDEDKDLVYDYFDKTVLGNNYRVPVINIDSLYAKNVNEEIVEYVEDSIKEYEKKDKLPEDAITTCDYIWAQNDNILSVVFFVGESKADKYYVYNVDIYTGEYIVNSEILDAAKMSSSEFANLCSDAVKDYFEKYAFDSSIEKYYDTDEYKSAKTETVGVGNFDSYTTMYLNKQGEVCIVAEISSLNDVQYDKAIIDIENIKRNSKPVFEGTNFPIKEFTIGTEDEEAEDE